MVPIQLEAAPRKGCGTVERAFQIARSGSCGGMSELVQMLKGERFEAVDEHLSGQSIRRDLRRAWESAGAADSAALAGQTQGPVL
ncbi:MAG TPA: hypothetical protein VK472_08145 [Allosphingosinicella sp.]|nr:hypothetical protein [Allosphingosinicella sp.]